MTKHSKSEHFDGKLFYNPTLEFSHPNFLKAIHMWCTTKKAIWPTKVANVATPNFPAKIEQDQVFITFVNHATFLIQIASFNILTDPVWSKRVSPFSWLGPARVREPGIEFDNLPHIDLVIISHNHYDHLDIKTLKKLQLKFNPKFYVPLGDKVLLESIGCTSVHEFDWWQSIAIDAVTKITFTPTQHYSSRSLFDQARSLWGGYMIQSNNCSIYFGGDAGYSKHFVDIFRKFGPVDVALLGIGAYEPNWFMKHMHMNPAEAVQAHLDLEAKQSIGMHFGTFQLSAEAIDQPVIDLKIALQQHNLNENCFITLHEGETKKF